MAYKYTDSLETYRVVIRYCVFSKILNIFRTLASLGFPSVSVCEHNGRSAAELAEFRKITTFEGKTQYLMNTL